MRRLLGLVAVPTQFKDQATDPDAGWDGSDDPIGARIRPPARRPDLCLSGRRAFLSAGTPVEPARLLLTLPAWPWYAGIGPWAVGS